MTDQTDLTDTSAEDSALKLAELEQEHRDLDEVIDRLGEQVPFDQLRLQRLKKRKLHLKDQITVLRARTLPDIIA